MLLGVLHIVEQLLLIKRNGRISMKIEGKDINLDFMIGGISILSFLGYFAFHILWLWFIIGPGIVLLFIHWKTSKFNITIESKIICFHKETFGYKLPTKCFDYDFVKSEAGSIVFSNNEDYLKVHFERESFDTVEFEINSKFYPIGTEQNAVEIMNELRKIKD